MRVSTRLAGDAGAAIVSDDNARADEKPAYIRPPLVDVSSAREEETMPLPAAGPAAAGRATAAPASPARPAHSTVAS